MDEELMSAPKMEPGANALGPSVKRVEGPPPTGEDAELMTAVEPKVSSTGTTAEPMTGWSGGYQWLGDRVKATGAALNNSGAGFMLAGGADMEVAAEHAGKMEMEEVSQHRDDFVNSHGYLNMFKLKDLPGWDKQDDGVVNWIDVPNTLIDSVPQLGVTVGGSMVGAAIGTAIFGAETVAIGALALTPAGWGALGVGALTTGAFIFGSHVYDAMNRGIKREDAVVGAAVSAGIGGVLATVGLHKLGELTPSLAKVVFQSQGFKDAALKVTGSVLKASGIDVGGNVLQSAVDSAAKFAEDQFSKPDKPFTLQQAMQELAQSAASGILVSGTIGTVTTTAGVHAGNVAKKAHADRNEAVSRFEDHVLQLTKQAKLIEDQEAQKRQQATDEKIFEQKIKARKTLKGFVEVDRSVPVSTAEQNLADAQDAHKAAPSTLTKAALNQAKAELQQAKLTERLDQIEEALTDPDLLATVKHNREVLEARIETLKEHHDAAFATVDKKVFAEAISKAQAQLTVVKQLEGLGSPEKIKAGIEATKAQLQGYADKTQMDVAKAALEHRMATRQKAIDSLEASAETSVDGVEQTVADAQAYHDNLNRPETPDEARSRVLNTPQYKRLYAKLAKADPTWSVSKLQRETFAMLKAKKPEIFDQSGLRGTVEQIEKAAKDLQAAKDREANRKAGLDRASHGDRIKQLREQQEIDKFVLELFENNELAPGEITDLGAQVPAKRLQGLVKLAQKRVEQASAMTGKEQTKLLKSAKKLLDGAISLSRLSTEDKNAMKAKYATPDLKTMQEVVPKLQGEIDKVFEKRKLEAAHADLKAQLDKLGVDHTERSKTPGTEELLSAIKRFAKDEDAVGAFLDSIQNKTDLTELEEQTLELTKLFDKPVEKMTATEIEAVIDAIVELRETGKAEALRQFEARKARRAEVKAEVLANMAPVGAGVEHAAHRQKEGIRQTLAKLLDDVANAESSSFRGLMTIINQFGSVSDLRELFDVKTALSDMHRLRIQWENRWTKILEERSINKGAWHKFNIKAHKRGERLSYTSMETLADGTKVEVPRMLEHEATGKAMTYWEMIQVRNYLLDTDPDAVSRFKGGNGYSYPNEVTPRTSTLEVIEAHLNENLPGWEGVADGQRQFYQEFGAVVNETTERRYGRSMPVNPTYGGQLLGSAEDGGRRETFRRFRSTTPGSAKQRQGGSHPVEIRSAIDNMKNHIAQFAREHAMYQLEADTKVFFDKDITKPIMRAIGENTVKVIQKYIGDVIYGQERNYTKIDRIAAALRENIYTRFLAARPEQFAKQLTGAIHALQWVSPEELVEGYAYMLANPAETEALMHESGLFQARRSGRDPDYRPDGVGSVKRFNNFLMHAVEVGDQYGSRGAGFPVYLKVLKATGDKAQAIKAFETAFDTTQSSGSVDELPSIFRAGPVTRFLTIMAQEPTRQWEAWNTVLREARQGKATKADVARKFAVLWTGAFLYNAMGYACSYPFLNDDQREKRFWYFLDIAPLGPLSGVALAGQILSSTVVLGMKVVFNQNTKAWEPKLLGVDLTADVWHSFETTLKLGSEGGDTADIWKAILLAGDVVSDVTGTPIKNILTHTLEPLIPGAKQ